MQAQNEGGSPKVSNDSDFFKDQTGIIKYYLLAIVIFGFFYIVYINAVLDSGLFGRYLEFLASLTSQFVNAVFGEESYVVLTEIGLKIDIWVSDGANVAVNEGCDGGIVFAILAATVLAWPSHIVRRIVVSLLGVALMFGLNVLRIAATLFADIYYPLQYDVLSEWILPNLLILFALLYFYIWTRLSGRHPDEWN